VTFRRLLPLAAVLSLLLASAPALSAATAAGEDLYTIPFHAGAVDPARDLAPADPADRDLVLVQWSAFGDSQVVHRRYARAMERFGFVLVATIRRDGTPRISPVGAYVVRRDLMLVMIGGSHKARDLARDSRLALQTPVTNHDSPESEAKVRGHVREVEEAQREATAAVFEAASGVRPPDAWRFFAVTLLAASCMPVPAATPSGRSWCWWTAGR
jgi:hypothetical protein